MVKFFHVRPLYSDHLARSVSPIFILATIFRKKMQFTFVSKVLPIRRGLNPSAQGFEGRPTHLGQADDLEKTIDYALLSRRRLGFGAGRDWKLIETLAVELAAMILREFRPEQVAVEVKKFVLPETRWPAGYPSDCGGRNKWNLGSDMTRNHQLALASRRLLTIFLNCDSLR
jgi:hypothetical protein